VTERLASLLGLFVLVGIGYALSEARRRVPWRVVLVGTLLQVVLALFLVRAPWVPWMLPAAAGACLLVVVRDAVRPSASFAPLVARGLAYVALLAVTLHLVVAALPPGYAALLLAGGAAAAVAAWRVPAARVPLAIAGCVGVPFLVLTGRVPTDFVFRALDGVGKGVTGAAGFATRGADMVFGGLRAAGGFVFAIDVGAIILLFSALMALLHYVGFLPWLVGVFARFFHRALRVSGAESLATAANIFIGQTEAPFVIRPFLPRLTRSETMALMAGGFATIAGSVLGAYVNILAGAGLARGAADLIAASVMSAPAAFVFAKLMVPERETPETLVGPGPLADRLGSSALDALAGGVGAGLRLAVNVVAMLLVFYAIVAMLNAAVDGVARLCGARATTFQSLYAYAFQPFAWLMGVRADECYAVGELLGTKTIFNEFVGYEAMAGMLREGRLSTRAAVLSTYALCGFANLMSIGVQIGGLSSLCPERRPLYVSLALRAMIAGSLACQMTACIVGVIGAF